MSDIFDEFNEQKEGRISADYKNNVEVKNTEQLLQELDQLIGLDQVKRQIRGILMQVQMNQERAARGLPTDIIDLNVMFVGNQGTGKTVVARIIGELYKSIGLLQSGQLIE